MFDVAKVVGTYLKLSQEVINVHVPKGKQCKIMGGTFGAFTTGRRLRTKDGAGS
jgi:hypothetical protein